MFIVQHTKPFLSRGFTIRALDTYSYLTLDAGKEKQSKETKIKRKNWKNCKEGKSYGKTTEEQQFPLDRHAINVTFTTSQYLL